MGVQPAGLGRERGSRPHGPAEVAGVAPRRGRLRWLFAAIWLVYLVPVAQDAMGRPLVSERVVGVTAVVGFAAVYVWSFAAVVRRRRSGEGVRIAWVTPTLAGSVALCAVVAVTVGESALGMLVFVAVQAVFMLPPRAGLVGAGLCLATEEGLSRVVPGWVPLEGLGFSLAAAAVAMWGVSGVLQRNMDLARAQATIAEMAVQAERSRFARDLHDILGHSLTVLTVKAELAGRLVAIDPGRAEREMAEVEQLARQALTDVRAAVGGYREATLPSELAAARAALDAAGITAELPSYVGGAVDHVPPQRRELLAWALREGVTNALRHSAARHVWVRLDADSLEVADDGRGSAAAAEAAGVRCHGLAGLRERAAAVGARVSVSGRDGGGFVLRVGWSGS